MELQVIAPRAHELQDGGLVWSGVLVVDGERVLRFANKGCGGCLDLDWRPRYARRAEVERALVAMSAAAIEPLDDAIGKLWDAAVMAGAQ